MDYENVRRIDQREELRALVSTGASYHEKVRRVQYRARRDKNNSSIVLGKQKLPQINVRTINGRLLIPDQQLKKWKEQ